VYLILAAKWGETLRFERADVPSTFAFARGLRRLGWAVTVLAPVRRGA